MPGQSQSKRSSAGGPPDVTAGQGGSPAEGTTVSNEAMQERLRDSEVDTAGGGGCSYTVQPGDTLWGISQRQRGDGRGWRDLYASNRDVVGDNPDLIFPGQELDVCAPGENEQVITLPEVLIEGQPEQDGVIELPEVVIEGDPGQQGVVTLPEIVIEGGEQSPEEQLAAAEAARDNLGEQMAGLEDLSEEDRAVVAQRVQGLSGEALVREMRMIENALTGPNASRALGSLAGLQRMLDEDEDNAERITPDVVEMMVNGVANRRTASERGQEGVLNTRSVQDSARALLEMSDSQYEETMSLLQSAGTDAEGNAVEGADAGAEQALILKAVGARREQLDTNIFQDAWAWLGGETESTRAMDEVRQFARDIRGTERAELINSTTLLDVDDANTSTVNPDSIAANNDATGDNDGLYQRYHDSCVPTVGQILRGERDPAFALRVHREGANSPSVDTETANEQQEVLENHGGSASSRLAEQSGPQITQMMDTMQTNGSLSGDQADLVNRVLAGEDMGDDQEAADQALAAVRLANGGRPTADEVRAIQFNQGRNSAGIGMTAGINDDVVTPDVEFDTHGTAGGPTAANFDDIEERLQNGEDVPFRVGWTGGGGHAMAITDTRTAADGTRSFLVTDPWTGATRWMTQAQLQDNNGINNTFGIGQGQMSHYWTEADQD